MTETRVAAIKALLRRLIFSTTFLFRKSSLCVPVESETFEIRHTCVRLVEGLGKLFNFPLKTLCKALTLVPDVVKSVKDLA